MDEGGCFCVVISDGRSLAPERDSCVVIVNLFFETVQAWQSNLDGYPGESGGCICCLTAASRKM